MITIFCGSDIAQSRKQFSEYSRKKSNEADSEAVVLSINSLEQSLKSAEHEQGLFHNNRFFLVENVLTRKKTRDVLVAYEEHRYIHIHIWEEAMEPRFVKMYFKKSKINTYDLPSSIWKLLDNIQPGSKSKVVPQLSELLQGVEEHFLLFMIQKRTKELILIQKNLTGGKKMADWQISRLKVQVKSWSPTQLNGFYSKLFVIEKTERVAATPYSIKQALEILFCFYL